MSGIERGVGHGFDGWTLGEARSEGATIAYRTTGEGPAVLLLHGWPMTGYEYARFAPLLASEHRVIVPDYRGAGASSMPEGPYTSMAMADDMVALLDHLGAREAAVIGHDIGMQIAVALALRSPDRVKSLVAMESVVPGLSAHQTAVASGLVWHFGFNASVDLATRLTTGRQRAYFEHFYDEFAGLPEMIGDDDRAHYAACFGSAERLRAGYRVYEAFGESGAWFRENVGDGLTMPTAIVCGEASLADSVPAVAKDLGAVRQAVLPRVGHFIPEEDPKALYDEVRTFWATSS